MTEVVLPDVTAEEPEISDISNSTWGFYQVPDPWLCKQIQAWSCNHTYSEPREFKISDELYNDFVAWLHDKDYDYITEAAVLDEENCQEGNYLIEAEASVWYAGVEDAA